MSVKRAFIILCTTIAILAVLEIIARIILSNVYNRKFDSSLIEEHKYVTSSGLKANARGMVWGKPFHTDEMGGRRQTKRKADKPKLLVIGDSVTEGVGVYDSTTFANMINDRVDSFDIRNISLIGWSVNDYNTTLHWLVNKDTTIKAVYVFYCLNDIYGRSGGGRISRLIGYGDWISGLSRVLQDHYATYKLVKLFVLQNSDKYYQYDRALYKDQDLIGAVMADLEHMKEECDNSKVDFKVFILPYRSQLQGKHDNLPQQVLIDQFKKKGINYLDLLPEMAKAGDPKSLYLFADEIHLSPMGHRAVADAIFHK